MEVISVTEHWDGRDTQDTTIGFKRYTRTFWVETDHPRVDGAIIRAHPSIPRYGTIHPFDNTCTRRELRITNRVEGPTFWRVDAEYSNEPINAPGDIPGNGQPANPLDWEAKVTWSDAPHQVFVNIDNNGKVIRNSSREPWNDVQKDEPRTVITVVKNLPNVPNWILKYRNAINSDDFTVDDILVNKGSAKIQSIGISPKRRLPEGNGAYREVTVVVHVQPVIVENGVEISQWQCRKLDRGYKVLRFDVGDDGNILETKHPETYDGTIINLDGNGNKLGDNEPPHILTFPIYRGLPFMELPVWR